MKRFSTFYAAWHFLHDHPIFLGQDEDTRFHEALYVEVVKVNPLTNKIDDNPKLNRSTRIWLECGPFHRPSDVPKKERPHYHNWREGFASHDLKLDCGGKSFEEIIIKLANLVMRHYGTDRTRVTL